MTETMTCCRCSWRGPVACFHDSEDLCVVCCEAAEGISANPRMKRAAEDFTNEVSTWRGLNIDSIHGDPEEDNKELRFE